MLENVLGFLKVIEEVCDWIKLHLSEILSSRKLSSDFLCQCLHSLLRWVLARHSDLVCQGTSLPG